MTLRGRRAPSIASGRLRQPLAPKPALVLLPPVRGPVAHVEHAGAVAGALNAERLVLLTDVEGVLDKDKKLVSKLTVREARALIADGTISGGMIPKIAGALDAAKSGVNAVHIIDGRVPHALLLEVLGNEPFGTMIRSH